ncbi:DUF3019 domain-containing protein [Shewanella zhangzhouensis]|uniref:DUF3019 domain-containing protein n=1 Tax=Shewanella zhangzhouensis TaxID=2864213 RepID=UPI001C658CB1|nr:DUF3019 domain-containing protein [Shewanella zhangzhouensis]QYK05426.1 DUF3019 domain-containing protein [Shewanella zhangzhouensis]
MPSAWAQTELALSPSQCVVDEGECQVRVTLSWQTESQQSVCIQVAAEGETLYCNLPANQSAWSLDVSGTGDVEFRLLSLDRLPLASARLRVLHIPKRKPRQRAAWSLF